MSGLPDTTSTKPRRRTVPWYAAFAAPVALVVVAATVFVMAGGDEPPEPAEEVHAGVEEIAAATEDGPFPRSDASRFDAGTPEVRVYLRVEDVPVAERMVATVERTGRASAFAALFGGADVRAEEAGEGRLAVSGGGASGVVSFAVRAAGGGPLPEGGYQVEVRFGSGGGGGTGRVAAGKYFQIGDPQD